MKVPLSPVQLDEEVERSVLEVLRSGRLSQGHTVEQLEHEFAALCGVGHAIAVANGTVALSVALEALGIGPGDEVITSPFTFVATLNAILERGATARFADIDATTFNVDPDAVADAVNERTAAVLPVHLYGLPADLERITPLTARHGIALVEDAAQAHGATVGDRAVGSFGTGCFSLYATKNVTSGEGGLVTTNDDALADALRLLRNLGMRDRYHYECAGHNYRLSEVHAAIALPQLRRLATANEQRRANARRLHEGLDGVPGLVTPSTPPGVTHVFHQYTVRITGDARTDRDELSARLAARGIGSGVYYPRVVFDYDCYRSHPGVVAAEMPEAARAAREVLSLPVHPAMSAADVDAVIEAVRAELGNE
jgi:dTDP-4-amino-4,6-dideoxygalactose transaminase